MTRSRVPGTYTEQHRAPHGTLWTTVYKCDVCGLNFVHNEVSPDHDEPDGLPLAMRICECGGTLWSVEQSGTG